MFIDATDGGVERSKEYIIETSACTQEPAGERELKLRDVFVFQAPFN